MMYGERPKRKCYSVALSAEEFMEQGEYIVLEYKDAVHFHITNPSAHTFSYAGIVNILSKKRNTYSFEGCGETTYMPPKLKLIEKVMLAPRLDVPFKNVGAFTEADKIPPIREHWKNFCENTKVDVTIELPLWMFNDTIADFFADGTEIFVPHKDSTTWTGGNFKFYMQTVFPWLFTVDSKGWGSRGSYMGSFDPAAEYTDEAFDTLAKYISEGNSKFPQPRRTVGVRDDYIFVPLQIPHDEVIRHSGTTCEEFVDELCKWADSDETLPRLVFKGHPVNARSMSPLKKIINKYKNHIFLTDVNIHQMMKESLAVFVINSGSGQEAMLLEKPVVCFGNSEYQEAVIRGDVKDIDTAFNQMCADNFEERIKTYKKWYHWYLNTVRDSNEIK